METTIENKKLTWTGRIISGLTVLFLIFDSAVKLVQSHWAMEATVQLGYSEQVVLPLGIVLLVSTVLYALPRTSVFGAILLAGYLGGATATHLRAGQPFMFPVVFGVLVWLGVWLRDQRLRALIPLRRERV
jgi:hypothetical protein